MVDPGTFVIHDSVRPPLPDGDYTLTVQQAIGVTTGPATIPNVAPTTSHFRIVGPRFTLPKDQQLSIYPPADSAGAYADRLPQIVLQRRTLPYERRIVLTDDPATTPPWLALVVLAEGEGQLVANQPVDTSGLVDPEDQDAAVQDVLRVSETVVLAVFPTLTDLPWLTHVREVDVSDTELALDRDGWMSVVVANRLPVPGPPDTPGGPATPRRYGAFLVSLEGHAGDLPVTETPVDTFTMLRVYDDATIASGVEVALAGHQLPLESLAVELRIPLAAADAPTDGATDAATEPVTAAPLGRNLGAAGAAFTGRAVAAARPSVPADAWSSRLADTGLAVAASPTPPRAAFTGVAAVAGFGLAPEHMEPLALIRTFTVLAHWSFTSEPEGDFRYLMQHVDLGMLGTPPPTPAPAEPGAAPPAPDPRPALTVLDTGHLAVAGIDRAGAPVTSWYRGPLGPRAILRPAATDPAGVLAWAADQLRRVGPDGREDLSLAVAFDLGRMLAAANPSVIAALLTWRQGGYGPSRVGALLNGGGTGLHLLLANVLAQQKSAFSSAVSASVLSTLGEAQALGPVRPLTSPPPVIPTGQGLAPAVARGFGLDLAVVSALLGVDPAAAANGSGLPGQATEPTVPQSVGNLPATSFATAGAATFARAAGILLQVGDQPAPLPAPVLQQPVGLIGIQLSALRRADVARDAAAAPETVADEESPS